MILLVHTDPTTGVDAAVSKYLVFYQPLLVVVGVGVKKHNGAYQPHPSVAEICFFAGAMQANPCECLNVTSL